MILAVFFNRLSFEFIDEFFVRMPKMLALVKPVRGFAFVGRCHFELQHTALQCHFFEPVEQDFSGAVPSRIFPDVHFLDFANFSAVVQQVLDVAAYKTDRQVADEGNKINMFRVACIFKIDFPLQPLIENGVFKFVDELINGGKIFLSGLSDLNRFQMYTFTGQPNLRKLYENRRVGY